MKESELEEEYEYYYIDDHGQEISIKTIPKVFWGVVIGLTICLVLASYLLYPFSRKLTGEWQSSNFDNTTLKISKSIGEIALANFSGNQHLTVIFVGNIKGTGVNEYEFEKIEGFINVETAGMSKEQVDKLKEEKELYKLQEEKKDSLQFKYTKEGLEQFLQTKRVAHYFKFGLENVMPWEEKKLYLNNSRLYSERIEFTLVD